VGTGTFGTALFDLRTEPLASNSNGTDEEDEEDEDDTEDEDDGSGHCCGAAFFWLRLSLRLCFFLAALDIFCTLGMGLSIHGSKGTGADTLTSGSGLTLTFANDGNASFPPESNESNFGADGNGEDDGDDDATLLRAVSFTLFALGAAVVVFVMCVIRLHVFGKPHILQAFKSDNFPSWYNVQAAQDHGFPSSLFSIRIFMLVFLFLSSSFSLLAVGVDVEDS